MIGKGSMVTIGVFGPLSWLLGWLKADPSHPPPPMPQLLIALAVLVLGPILLLVTHRRAALQLSRPWWIATIVGAVGLSGLGLLVTELHVCCMFSYTVLRGFPMHWMS